MRETATMKVEFMPGSTIKAAFEEAIRLATLLNVWIEFNFNGVTCSAKSSSNAELGVVNYQKALSGDSEFKIAFA
jgi:hypothetical protein